MQCETICGHSKCNIAPSNEKNLKDRLDSGGKKSTGKIRGRTCGEPCPSCREKCSNRCEHRACTKDCGDICDVEPCMQPCRKLLRCSPWLKPGKIGPINRPHLCVGMCGEECPPFCRICDPLAFKGDENTISEVFLGREDESDAHYVQLKDCGHYFEVNVSELLFN